MHNFLVTASGWFISVILAIALAYTFTVILEKLWRLCRRKKRYLAYYIVELSTKETKQTKQTRIGRIYFSRFTKIHDIDKLESWLQAYLYYKDAVAERKTITNVVITNIQKLPI